MIANAIRPDVVGGRVQKIVYASVDQAAFRRLHTNEQTDSTRNPLQSAIRRDHLLFDFNV